MVVFLNSNQVLVCYRTIIIIVSLFNLKFEIKNVRLQILHATVNMLNGKK